jgi:hypothetical protein
MTNPIIKPTVGRVVWFHPSELTCEAGFARHKDGQPYAAIIARVFDFDALVNLTVFDANGHAHSRTSVPLVQDGASVPGSGYYCEWMPYQKGQAAKTEAAEKDAAEAQPAYRQRTQREELEYNLVAGAASHLAQVPSRAREIAQGIKVVLDELHPSVVSPDTRALERQFERKPTALPVIDPGPDSLEREIQAKANRARRVTPADIEAEIASEHYFTAREGVLGELASDGVPPSIYEKANAAPKPLGLLTFCVLVLRNGFTVTGESACASPENFNAEIGRRIARDNAVNKVWPLLGFRLRDELARPVLTDADAAADLAGTPRPDRTGA